MAAVPYTQVPSSAWDGAETVYLPYRDFDQELIEAIYQAVPDGATFGFNHDYERAWVTVTKPGDTHGVVAAALRSLGREWPAEPGPS
jgi:hypothetical protein